MSENIKVLIDRSDLVGIANTIRNKTGSNSQMTFGEFTTNISGITGVELPSLDNPATNAEVFEGYEVIDGKGQKQTGTFTIDNELTTQDNLISQIQAVVDSLPEAGGDKEVSLQNKIVTPTTSSQIVKADSGYDGLDTVTVNAMPTTAQATPSISVDSNGKITASTTQSAGYVTAGTKSATKQLTTQAAKTITPSTSSQTAIASGVYTTGAVTVAAIPSTYVKPAATKSATTYTPTTSDQTIAAGTYCSGVQTIKGDANLIPANIVSGKSIFGVAGSATTGGSGGGSGENTIEMYTVQIKSGMSPVPELPVFYYTDANFSCQSIASAGGISFTVPKNTLVAVTNWSAQCRHTGCEQIFYNMGYTVYQITNNAVITVEMG